MPIEAIIYNGAAANALRGSRLVSVLTDGKGNLYQSTQATDLVATLIGGNSKTSDENAVTFPESHSSYTGFLPDFGAYIGGKNMRNLTDSSWGKGKYSIPLLVKPSDESVKSNE